MDAPYPTSPSNVPPDLTAPTASYRRQTWASVGALLAFALVYLGLAGWFGRTAWRLIEGGFSSNGVGPVGFLLAVPPLFLFAFLAKGLFFVRRGTIGDALEVTAADEPVLFAFIHRVADEAGAPRPHRVFLTPDVNASVFHDLSFRNLVWPSKKNLNIGLGLVNVLTLDELKAVLAHEFGHFAQRTMALGTWVYVAQQAIGAIVGRRDGFDRFLDGLSRFDLRIAWIGWVMRLVVWSIRVVLDTAFRGLVYLDRALSREMEFQADLVSVALCGSDSLVHALRRLGPADEAMQRALAFASRRGRAGAPIADVWAVQTRILGQLRMIRNDPTLGHVPARPEADAATHRVFTRGVVEVPRMWATHPPSHEREVNMKRRYVASPLDERPGWSVFADPEATRRRLTASLYAANMPDAAGKPVSTDDEANAHVDASFARPAFDTAWRGVYVGRSVVRGEAQRGDLYGALPTDRDAIRAALDGLYPETLVETLRAWRESEEQVAQLAALAAGILRAPGGIIHFRGRTIRKHELEGVLAEARTERDALRTTLAEHDRAVRTAHRAAARALGRGWDEHHLGLVSLLHAAEHLEGDLADADGALANVFRIVTADGNVSGSELVALVAAANVVHGSLSTIYGLGETLGLPAPVAARLEVASWPEVLGEALALPPATRENLADNWLAAAATWVGAARGALDGVAAATLDTLLEAESHVARCFREGTDPGDAPVRVAVPGDYPTLTPAQERPRQARLGWWDSFQTADGWLPGVARFGAAAGVLAPAFFFTAAAGTATVYVHNGLDVPVRVTVGERAAEVPPGGERALSIATTADLAVAATTLDGRPIESFTADADEMWGTYVYNVASADVLAILSIGYGTASVPEPRSLGTTRWSASGADYTFAEPPRSIDADGPTIREQLVSLDDLTVGTRLSYAGEGERVALTTAHLLWDDVGGPGFLEWALVAKTAGVPLDEVLAILRARAEHAGGRVALGRLEQDLGGGEVCAAHAAAAAARPEDPDAAYLALRCLPDGAAAGSIAGAAARFPDHPWIGWAQAWEQTRVGDWQAAAATIERVAPELRVLGANVALTRLRALRMAGADLDAQVSALAGADFVEERAFLAAEAGAPATAPEAPWHTATFARVSGDLADATARSATLGEEGAWHTWMIAGSDGASHAQVAEATALTGEAGLDAHSVWVALALLAREGKDATAALALAERAHPERVARLRPVLEAPTPAAVVDAVEAACIGADATERGWARMVGLVRLGDDAAAGALAPPSWRREAIALLLPWERPFLAPEQPLVVETEGG